MTQRVIVAILSAIAAYLVIGYDTPIDRALPFCAIVIVVSAFIAKRDENLIALPLLFGCEIAIDDERMRLLAIGLVVASALAASAVIAEHSALTFTTLGVMATLLLRWIPITSVSWFKELLILGGVIALLLTMKRRTPASLAIVVAIALVTPSVPGRMVFYPALVALTGLLTPFPIATAIVLAIAAIVSRYSLVALYAVAALAMVKLPRVTAVFGFLLLALWPWSGMTSRLLSLPKRSNLSTTETVGAALESSQSVDVDLPRNVRHVVMRISGANMAHMRPKREVGTIEYGSARRVLRIGDVADFGFMRREQFFFSRNVPPRVSCGDVRGYGNASYLWGAGCIDVTLDRALPSLRVVAANDLPRGAKLQVESIEYDSE